MIERLLGPLPYKQETVEREGVRTHFIATATAKLELLEALGPESPVARFLEKRGPGLHHLAFEVDDLDATLARAKALGFMPLREAPRAGADGKRIFFLHPKQTHGLLIECCESTPTPFMPAPFTAPRGIETAYSLGTPAHPPLLLLPGTPVERAEALIRRLEPFFYLLTFDTVGATPPTPETLTACGAAMLEAAQLGNAHVFGSGAGSAGALLLARTYPERVKHLAVLGLPFSDRTALQHPESILAPTLVSTVDRAPDGRLEAHLELVRALPSGRLSVMPGTALALDSLNLDVLVPLLLAHFMGK